MEYYDAIIQGQRSEIQSLVKTSYSNYNEGIAIIDRSDNNWSVPEYLIDTMHSKFAQSYNTLQAVEQKSKTLKANLDRYMEQTVAREGQVSVMISDFNQQQSKVNRLLTYKENEVKTKASELQNMKEHCHDLERDLDNKREEHAKVAGAAAGIGIAAVQLLLSGPLVGAALATTAAGLLVAIGVQEEKIKSLAREISDAQSEYDGTSSQYDTLKNEARKLASEIYEMKRKCQDLESTKSHLRQKLQHIPQFSENVKDFLHKLGLLMNKIELLTRDTDPEYFYDASMLKGPIRELEGQAPLQLRFQ